MPPPETQVPSGARRFSPDKVMFVLIFLLTIQQLMKIKEYKMYKKIHKKEYTSSKKNY